MARVAIIGLGHWGPNLARNFHFHLGKELVTCCDLSLERAQRIGRQYPTVRIETDPQKVFEDKNVDAVAIATPVNTHHALVKSALLAGKSVFVEKPLAASVAEAEELVDLADRQGLVLMVDHVFVHNNAVQRMKTMLDDGELGELLYVDSVRINLGRIQSDVNVVWDLAPHDLSIVDHLVGRLPASVSAFGASHTEQGLEDVAYVNMDFGRGLIANFHVNWLSPVKIRYTILGGSKKSVTFNDLHPAELIKVFDSGVEVQQQDLEGRRRLQVDYRTGDVWSPHIPRMEPLSNAVRDFLACVDRGGTPLTDGKAGLRIVRILEAIQQSIRQQGARIDFHNAASPAASADQASPSESEYLTTP